MKTKKKYHDYRDYPRFYNNIFIKSIAPMKKWSISDKNKMPVCWPDLEEFIKTGDKRLLWKRKRKGKWETSIRGADQDNPEDMTTLKNLLKYVPNASNHAYMLNTAEDRWVVLDIEKTATAEQKKKFLQIPYFYGEHSLSGKGIHLICKLPVKEWQENPRHAKLPKLQSTDGSYEILMHHWVTFTRNNLQKISNMHSKSKYTIKDIFLDLVAQNKDSRHLNFDVSRHEPKIPNKDQMLRILSNTKYNYHKKVTDFPQKGRIGDYSKYEFGMAIHYAGLINMIAHRAGKNKYTDGQKAWLVYFLLKKKLKHRDKHDTMRHGVPLLLYDAQSAVEHYIADKKKKKKKEDKQ